MHHNLLLAWLAAKPIANYDASIILVMYLKNSVLNLLCMLEFYTTLLVYLFSQWFHTFKSFSNLHFLGLAFFYIRDVFGIGYRIFFETAQVTKIHVCTLWVWTSYSENSRWSFYTGSLQDRFHCNSSSQEQ